MRQEHLLARKEHMLDLADKGYDLFERISAAGLDYIDEWSPPLPQFKNGKPVPIFESHDGKVQYAQGQPKELSLDRDYELQVYASQISMASSLIDSALMKAEILAKAAQAEIDEKAEEAPAPVLRPAGQRSTQEKPVEYSAVTRSDEEIAAYTESVVSGIWNEFEEERGVSKINPNTSEVSRKKEFIADNTVIHVKNGNKRLKKELPNRFILEQNDLSQIVIWAAQARGPRHQPRFPLPQDRLNFIEKQMNSGRLDEDEQILAETGTLWQLLDKASERGWLTDGDDPDITAEGFDYIEALLTEYRPKQKGNSFAFSK